MVTKQKSTLHTHLLAKVGKVKEIKFKKIRPKSSAASTDRRIQPDFCWSLYTVKRLLYTVKRAKHTKIRINILDATTINNAIKIKHTFQAHFYIPHQPNYIMPEPVETRT
ncbi:MAG: hypothetical protein RIR11_1796 [Bacteroidota bacterium]